jgi:replicative DNA helicase
MLVSTDALTTGMEQLQKDDFYSRENSELFVLICEMYYNNRDIDQVTIMCGVKESGRKIRDEYIYDIITNQNTTPVIEEYCRILRARSNARKIIKDSYTAAQSASDIRNDPLEVVGKLENSMMGILQSGTSSKYVYLHTELPGFLERIQAITKGDTSNRIKSGFYDLDKITGGFEYGTVWCVAGRPSMGKTSLALNIMHNAAKNGVKSCIYSFEMTKAQITSRMVSMESGISLFRLNTSPLTKKEFESIGIAANRLNTLPLVIDDETSVRPLELKAKARRLIRKEKVKLLVVDYLQLMSGEGGEGNRNLEIQAVSRSLKAIAKDLNIVVIAVSQLSRDCEKRGRDVKSKTPQMYDLREGGDIEQDVEGIIFPFRPAQYDDTYDESDARLIVAKNRNGQTGTCEVGWHGLTASFYNAQKNEF